MGNRDVCGVPGVLWGGCRVEGGRGGVNLDVSGDRAPRLGSSSLLEVRCVLLPVAAWSRVVAPPTNPLYWPLNRA